MVEVPLEPAGPNSYGLIRESEGEMETFSMGSYKISTAILRKLVLCPVLCSVTHEKRIAFEKSRPR